MKTFYVQVTFSAYTPKPISGPATVFVNIDENGLIQSDDARINGFTIPGPWWDNILQGHSSFGYINDWWVAFHVRPTSDDDMTDQQAREIQRAESGYPQ